MPTTRPCNIKDLTLDLHNFRTLPQRSELGAVRAIIAAKPDWFWSLTTSLLDNGYLPNENILVLKKGGAHVVKEGNRRIGALKLIHGLIKRTDVGMPADISERIAKLDAQWKKANGEVPCAVYPEGEEKTVDKIVTLTHGKSEKAGRDKWEAVARARHNRDMNGGREYALDLLEAYLKHGKNLTDSQKERWGGDYQLTVLEEAMKKWAERFGATNSKELAEQYPKKTKHRSALESILHDVGTESLSFKQLRDGPDIGATKYGLPPIATDSKAGGSSSGASGGGSSGSHAGGSAASGTAAAGGSGTAAAGAASKTKAVGTDDPRSVSRILARFSPVGDGREKIVTLRDEAKKLKLKDHPHAFCFVLRSMFELSAKAYCKDHAKSGGPKTAKADGKEKSLAELLRDIVNHLTQGKSDKDKVKQLHGAMTELAEHNGLLSVTSMNQLVHNPKFAVDEKHICTVFNNIFPLLEDMNG